MCRLCPLVKIRTGQNVENISLFHNTLRCLGSRGCLPAGSIINHAKMIKDFFFFFLLLRLLMDQNVSLFHIYIM